MQRIVLIDPVNATRQVLARRLRAQGYAVEEATDAAMGANMALCSPPFAVVADLWMQGISGVQLCRLLRSEPATATVPVVLCGDSDDPRGRFWAARAGAKAFVSKHRTGELVRALALCSGDDSGDSFFIQLGGTADIRDRIAQQLDTALFESVIAAEVRSLAACGEFDRLFDLLAQFFSQVSRYRWLALSTNAPERIAVHHRPGEGELVDQEIRKIAGPAPREITLRIEDEDAYEPIAPAAPVVREIPFGGTTLGFIAVAPCTPADSTFVESLVELVAREVGGPMRIASLMEYSQRLAATDSLTGLMNRRSFLNNIERELPRSERYGHPLSLILLDVDHFKKINDKYGHATGDRVLEALGKLLAHGPLRQSDLVARWGGEEFVIAYLSTPGSGAAAAAERLRAAIEALEVRDDAGTRIPVTASIGLSVMRQGDSLSDVLGRADAAMYESKTAGRNRVTICGEKTVPPERGPDGPHTVVTSLRPSARPRTLPVRAASLSERPSRITRTSDAVIADAE